MINPSYQNEQYLFGRSGFQGFTDVMNTYEWMYKVKYGCDIKKIYNCLNRNNLNNHRRFVFESLSSNDLLKYGYVSYWNRELPKEIEDSGYHNDSELKHLHTTHSNFLPKLIEQTFL